MKFHTSDLNSFRHEILPGHLAHENKQPRKYERGTPVDVDVRLLRSPWSPCSVTNRVETTLRTTTSQKCTAVPRRARVQGSWIFVSPKSRLERNKEEEEQDDEDLM